MKHGLWMLEVRGALGGRGYSIKLENVGKGWLWCVVVDVAPSSTVRSRRFSPPLSFDEARDEAQEALKGLLSKGVLR